MQCMKSIQTLLTAFSLALFVIPTASVAADAPKRPPIVGVAWIGLRTADMPATRKFYTEYLGLPELPGVKDAANGGLTRTVFKVNERQFVQVLPELKDPKQNRLIDIAFETSNAEQLRAYLASNDVKVPDKIADTGMGTKGFSITDAENHVVKFVQFSGKSKSKN